MTPEEYQELCDAAVKQHAKRVKKVISLLKTSASDSVAIWGEWAAANEEAGKRMAELYSDEEGTRKIWLKTVKRFILRNDSSLRDEWHGKDFHKTKIAQKGFLERNPTEKMEKVTSSFFSNLKSEKVSEKSLIEALEHSNFPGLVLDLCENLLSKEGVAKLVREKGASLISYSWGDRSFVKQGWGRPWLSGNKNEVPKVFQGKSGEKLAEDTLAYMAAISRRANFQGWMMDGLEAPHALGCLMKWSGNTEKARTEAMALCLFLYPKTEKKGCANPLSVFMDTLSRAGAPFDEQSWSNGIRAGLQWAPEEKFKAVMLEAGKSIWGKTYQGKSICPLEGWLDRNKTEIEKVVMGQSSQGVTAASFQDLDAWSERMAQILKASGFTPISEEAKLSLAKKSLGISYKLYEKAKFLFGDVDLAKKGTMTKIIKEKAALLARTKNAGRPDLLVSVEKDALASLNELEKHGAKSNISTKTVEKGGGVLVAFVEEKSLEKEMRKGNNKSKVSEEATLPEKRKKRRI